MLALSPGLEKGPRPSMIAEAIPSTGSNDAVLGMGSAVFESPGSVEAPVMAREPEDEPVAIGFAVFGSCESGEAPVATCVPWYEPGSAVAIAGEAIESGVG